MLRAITTSVFVRRSLLGILGAAFALALLPLYSQTTAQIGPGELRLSAGLASGGVSHLDLPPLGDVRAHTHDAPLSLTATLRRLDTSQVQRLIAGEKPADELTRSIEADLDGALRSFVVRELVGAAVVGFLIALLISRRDRWSYLICPGVAVLTVGILTAVAWRTYDLDAFDEPNFTGSLVEAPRIIETVRRHVDSIEVARSRATLISDRLADLYRSSATEPQEASGDEVRVLHVSDLHSNPVGVEFARSLAVNFDVDAILDTGDVTSFGLPVEQRFTDLLAGMPAPYYVIPGNHDSPENRAALEGVVGVDVLDGDVVSVRDVQVLGVADPTFTADNRLSTEEANRLQQAAAPLVAQQLAEHPEVDILAVHSSEIAKEAVHGVPLVLSGHAHRRSVSVIDGKYQLVVGSTGAGGLGVFAEDGSGGYEAQILNFRHGELVWVDYVRSDERQGDFSVSRNAVPLEPSGG